MEHDCRIRLKDTNYKEYSNYSILGEESYEACAKIYIQYCEYKQFGDMIPLFKEEFNAKQEAVAWFKEDNPDFELICQEAEVSSGDILRALKEHQKNKTNTQYGNDG